MVKIAKRDKARGRKPHECVVCGTKIYAVDRKYCSAECKAEQSRLDMLARRPAQGSIKCAYCDKEIDVLSRDPGDFRQDIYFCDNICAVGYAVQHGRFKSMSEIGNAKIQAYQAKSGKRYAHEHRSDRTSKANIANGPRCKLRKRTGYVWGWLVEFQPDGQGTGYIARIPELIGYEDVSLPCSTVKSGLAMWRAKFVELRVQERQADK